MVGPKNWRGPGRQAGRQASGRQASGRQQAGRQAGRVGSRPGRHRQSRQAKQARSGGGGGGGVRRGEVAPLASSRLERGELCPTPLLREVPMNFATLDKKWFHEVAEKTARERRSNGQTEPRANQVLWPVAFPITLRLGSPPVCVPKATAAGPSSVSRRWCHLAKIEPPTVWY
uniref:Uncharacterized protein n=1 Tax=Vespula pensylvanica TaxID=30213 RepID=A0A834U983_VESPE|nr:hypothetical protein H0235_008589 [Vespula pensylvanica]